MGLEEWRDTICGAGTSECWYVVHIYPCRLLNSCLAGWLTAPVGNNPVTSVDLSKDGTMLLSGSGDGEARLCTFRLLSFDSRTEFPNGLN